MFEADADQQAEKPKRARKVGGGTAEDTGDARQADTARGDDAGDGAPLLMEEVVRRENVVAAYKREKRNGGAPGVDGVTVDELADYCRAHWDRIRGELLSDVYRPQPVRRVEIPKPDGKGKRMLGIPTVIDRLIQQALQQVLQPIFDPTFSDDSYAYRPGRSTHDAVLRAREHIAAGHRWVVDFDLEKFFDRVNHDVLMARLARRVKDKRVLRLIRRCLQAGIMADGLVSPRTEGTPQGSPLSPLLSNILLDELDKELDRRGHRYARYADDCNVYVRSRRAGGRVMDSVERLLHKRLRLRINRDKSAVERPWKRKFLGYSVTHHRQPRLKVAPESLRRLKGKLRDRLRQTRGRHLETVMEELTPLIKGWVGYFRLSEVRGSFEQLDEWLRRRIRAAQWRQWKKPRTRARKLIRLGLDPDRAWSSAYNGRAPWWNAGASDMHQALPTRRLQAMGLASSLSEYRRLTCNS